MPEEPLKPVGKITFNDGNRQTNMPVGSITFDDVTDMSKFVAPKDNNIESIIDELSRTSRGGKGLLDSEKEILKNLLTNPNTTPEQARKGIATIQGYDEKHDDDNTYYYVKNDENGVMMPYALAKGERPPQGASVPSVWGTQKDANDDSWYTDALKSLYNAVPGVIGSVADLGQLAYKGVTGEASENLNDVKLLTESLRMAKDEDLNKQIYNTEGVKKWSDLVASERFDFGPEAIWGTLNSALETVPQFFLGAGAAAKGIQGVTKAAELSKKAAAASAFTGSFLTMLGDNMDAAEEAGLKGRDVAKFAMTTTAAQAAIDASLGLPSKIFMNSVRQSEKELMKGIAKTIEKDASGLITEEGFKQLAREVPVAYSQMVKVGAKEILKDASREAAQEVSQDVIEKSAKQLWDKMSDSDKGKFGVDALSPESFASYIQNGIAGFVSGGPMAVASTNYKKKYQEQSKELLDRVNAGPEAINELKANLNLAKDRGELTEQEYNQAMFKVDAYSNYNEQTKDLDLNDEQKKEAFELSFNIDALKSEIPTSKEDVDKLDPIAQAKINSKKELMKGLQKKLDEIILNNQVKKETKVDEKTADKTIPKEEGQTGKSLEELLKEYGKTDVGAKEVDVEGILSEEKKRAKITDNAPIDWNTKLTSLQRKQIVQEHLKSTTKNEMPVNLQQWENGKITAVIDGEGRRMDLAQSAPSNTGETKDYLNRKALPEFTDELSDPNGVKYKKASEPVMMKRVDIDAFNYENDTPDLDNDGNQKRKGILVLYNPKSGEYIGNIRELDKIGNYKYTPSRYSPSEVAQMDSLKKINFNTDEINPFLYRPKPEKASGKTAPTKAQNDSEMGQNLQDVNVKPTKEAGVQRELTPEEKELKAAAKPEIKLDYIKDEKILDKDVKTTIETASGESMNVLEKAKKAQSRIKKNMKLLEEVLNCLHG